MIVQVNSNRHEAAEGTTLSAFIDSLGIGQHGIAVAIDYEVIPKTEWDETLLTDGVELMLITAVSGG